MYRQAQILAFLVLAGAFMGASAPGSYARGGEGSGGGGDVIVCERNGIQEIRLADTFEIFRSGMRIKYPPFEVKTFEQMLGSFLEARYSDLRQRLLTSLAHLTFVPVDRIPELDDDFIASLPAGCRKKQLAIQNLKTGIVRYDMKIYFGLRPVERALFHLHEALVRIRGETGDTTPLRRRLKRGYESSLDSALIVEAAQHVQHGYISNATKLGNALVFAAMEVCFQLHLKSCAKDFIDLPFEKSCGLLGSPCDRRFKSLFDRKIVELGLRSQGLSEEIWKSEIHSGRRVFTCFYTLPSTLRREGPGR